MASAHHDAGNHTTAKDLSDVADTLEKLYAVRDAAEDLAVIIATSGMPRTSLETEAQRKLVKALRPGQSEGDPRG